MNCKLSRSINCKWSWSTIGNKVLVEVVGYYLSWSFSRSCSWSRFILNLHVISELKNSCSLYWN
jgi:hypothetical protein